jgi:hypothetical protein
MDRQSHIPGKTKNQIHGTAETRPVILVLVEEHAIATSGAVENGRPVTPRLAQEIVIRSPTNTDILKILEMALKQGPVTAR